MRFVSYRLAILLAGTTPWLWPAAAVANYYDHEQSVLPAPVHPWDRQFDYGDETIAQQETQPAPTTQQPATGSQAQPAPDENLLPDLSGEEAGEDMSVGEIPTVETVELTPDTARKALDAYLLVKEKYKDAELENYENLQDFVEQNAQGRPFEADIKSFGFADVNKWNIAVTTISFAYSNLLDDQTEDLKQQIEDVKADTEMAQDMRDRMVKALTAMIPSENNHKIVEEMSKDSVYGERLKQLETEEE